MTGECTNLVIVGVGGQGIILLTRILGETALDSNLNVMESEIHGMAQRGGQVMSTIRIGDVHSPMIGEGEADIILGMEPVETYRHLNMASKNTTVVTSTNPVYPFTVTSGDEEYPNLEDLLSILSAYPKKLIKLDAEKITLDSGLPNIVSNMIMLGAILGACPDFPVSYETIKETIKQNVPIKYVDENIKAFELGITEAKKHS
ncbi:MAG: indolepyruvate ferredoxin oxidoreductase subunit beta [Thermoplasmata archaeon]|nr:MAG: indolepyruvate ferredoxin oxidoreductase subunit beta [Thermoplasmata archaeon]